MSNPARSSRAQEIMAKAVKDAGRRERQVHDMSKVLADLLQEIHGGSWSVDINHRTQFVLIAQDMLGSTGGVRNV